MREHHTGQSLNAWLDTPGGQAMCAQYGSRHAAARALAEAEAQDQSWRRQVANERFERYPSRYESPTHAMADIPEPKGGCSAWMTGTTDEIVSAGRYVDPAAGWRNLGGEVPDGAAEGIVQAPGRGWEPADTRPPWQRG